MRHLLGFGDFEEAYIGAKPAKKSATTVIKPSKVKGKPWGTAVDKSHSPHKKSMVSTISAGKKAVEAGKKAAAVVKKYKPTAHAPLVKLTASMSPKGTVMLGVVGPLKSGIIAKGPAAPGAKILTPKQKVAVAKHTNAIAKHALATKRLNVLAAKASKKGKDALDFAKKTAPLLKAALAGKGTKKHLLGLLDGVDIDALGDAEVVGLCEMLGIDAAGLNPGEEGYDPTTDPDSPSYVDPNKPVDDYGEGAGGVVLAPDGTVLYDPATDPAIVPIPERGGTLSQADASAIWQKVPEDGIMYDGGFGDRDKGSYGFFYGPPNPHGAQLGGTAGMIWGGGDGNWHAFGTGGTTRWIRRYGQAGGPDPATWWLSGSFGGPVGLILPIVQLLGQGNDNWDDGFATDKAAWLQSQKDNQGPLIGNPKNPAVAGLQYAVSDDKWFWQGKNAPASAAAEADAKIALANQKTIAANTAAAQVQAAALAKTIAEENEAKAHQDAMLQLQEEADTAAQTHAEATATAAETVAEQAQAQQQAQMDIEYQRQQDVAEAAQTQADIDRQKQELAMEAEAQHALVAESAAYNEWAAAHPEEAYAAAQPPPEEAPPEEPSMFEEAAQPDGDEPPPNWPFDEEGI